MHTTDLFQHGTQWYWKCLGCSHHFSDVGPFDTKQAAGFAASSHALALMAKNQFHMFGESFVGLSDISLKLSRTLAEFNLAFENTRIVSDRVLP